LEYGPDTINKEPPLNKIFYTFPGGASIMYLGSNQWRLEVDITKTNALKEALRKITPVKSQSF
jgi:hypothetical protein